MIKFKKNLCFCLKGIALSFISLFILSCKPPLSSENLLKPAFWLAQKEENKAYILGTVHFGVSIEDLKCHNKIKSYLEGSDELLSEVYKASDLDPKKIEIESKYFLSSITKREQLLNKLNKTEIERLQKNNIVNGLIVAYYGKLTSSKQAETFEKLSKNSQNYLKKYGLHASNKSYAEYFKDIFARFYYKALSDILLLDVEITNFALDKNKPIQTLDTPALFNNAIKPINIDINRQKIITAQDIDNLIENEEIWIKEYLKINNTGRKVYENWDKNLNQALAVDTLLKQRNEHWLSLIQNFFKRHQSGTVFIVGGLAHFFSSNNVLELLKKDGFGVQLIDSENCQF